MGTSGARRRSGVAAPGSLGWWLLQLVGLLVSLALMLVLAYALSMLTRMLVEGDTEPEPHLPTIAVWFVLCVLAIIVPMLRGTWRELKDEQVHVDSFGNELRIDRWSPPHERERFAERVAADERARAHERRDHWRPPAAVPTAVTSAGPPPEATDDEQRAAALRRRETGPDLPSSVRVGRWSTPLRRLHTLAMACLIAWLPLALVATIVLVELQDTVPSEWGLLPFVLLPIGWLLMEAHHLLRHRWLRTRETRAALADFHLFTAFVGAVIFALTGFTGLVMREEAIGVALVSFPLMVLCIWVIRRELRHHVPGRSGDASTDHTIHWDSSPDMSVSDVNPFD